MYTGSLEGRTKNTGFSLTFDNFSNYAVYFMMLSENNLYNRYISEILPGELKGKKIVLITGARQTGKTTLAKTLYGNLKYINLDLAENRDAIQSISALNWEKDVGAAVIDEAQKEPSLFEKIKYAYDEDRIYFQVLLGSSQIMLLKRIRESLAGRIWIYELYPLMMSELAESQGYPLIDLIIKEQRLDEIMESRPSVLFEEEALKLKGIEDYLLKWGGMPALTRMESDEERKKWLRDYHYTYLERDLSDLARLEYLEPFKKFQKIAALRSGNILNYSDLARDCGISVDTAKRYFEYLKISYQVIFLPPYYRNLTSSVIKTNKLYVCDIGLMRSLSGIYGALTGEIYETMVITEIYKWIKTMQRDCSLYFYRTRSGLEVDLLIETERGITAVEVKARETVSSVDIKGMKTIAEKLGNLWRGGIVVYRGSQIKKLTDNEIWAIPSWRLFS